MLVWGGGYDHGGAYALGSAEDADGDGWAECAGDCNDDLASVFPGAEQVCDGLQNDCGAPIWPAVSATEIDDDGDGYVECEPWAAGTEAPALLGGGDCDDGDATVYPGAPEINDGQDNQCPGSAGHGVVDEISGTALFHSRRMFVWQGQQGATLYEAARSSHPTFPTGCLLQATPGTSWADNENPPAGGVFHYLVRALMPLAGSWGQDSAGNERVGVCSGGAAPGR
jgi:hypothetical protein